MIFREPKIEDFTFLEGVLLSFSHLRIADVRRSNRGKILEITLHNPEGQVTGDDCDRVSETLSNSPEFYEHFGSEIAISVASPGLDRKIATRREIEVFAGREVKVFYDDDKGPREMTGILLKAKSDDGLSVSEEGAVRDIPMERVRALKLYHDFDKDDL